jgi:hypothetical protein
MNKNKWLKLAGIYATIGIVGVAVYYANRVRKEINSFDELDLDMGNDAVLESVFKNK